MGVTAGSSREARPPLWELTVGHACRNRDRQGQAGAGQAAGTIVWLLEPPHRGGGMGFSSRVSRD